jgi:hypothetical protein
MNGEKDYNNTSLLNEILRLNNEIKIINNLINKENYNNLNNNLNELKIEKQKLIDELNDVNSENINYVENNLDLHEIFKFDENNLNDQYIINEMKNNKLLNDYYECDNSYELFSNLHQHFYLEKKYGTIYDFFKFYDNIFYFKYVNDDYFIIKIK